MGRYGDPICAQGYLLGIAHMSKLLHLGGIFYLATPIGRERVEFNANWVFDPRTIIKAAESSGLSLKKLITITPDHGPHEIEVSLTSLHDLSLSSYKLGLFIFEKSI